MKREQARDRTRHRTVAASMAMAMAAIGLSVSACASTVDTAATSTTGPKDAVPAGSTAPGSTAPNPCPDETVLTISTKKGGDRRLDAVSSYADVTLDSSMTLTITNYPLPKKDAQTVFQPTLTGDQLAANAYLSATQNGKLTTGTYPHVGDKPDSRYQLNTYLAFSADGREISGGVNLPRPWVSVTYLDTAKVCGEFHTPEIAGRFTAQRI